MTDGYAEQMVLHAMQRIVERHGTSVNVQVSSKHGRPPILDLHPQQHQQSLIVTWPHA